MGKCIKELAYYLIKRAQENLELSRKLYNDGDYGFSLNRSYNAVFNAMRAVNSLDAFDSSKHSGVIAHFNQCHVKEGHFPSYTSSEIRDSLKLRERADYEIFYDPSSEEAFSSLEKAAKFISLAETYINSFK
ncbi:MAG: HEPN domain-containing protein [Lachnospiraceae bacterium]|nr:HEPN domain-containing protein [Lachnospiraceae bacterium]